MTRLVLLPGLDASGTLYDAITAALPDRYPLTALSYPTDQPLDYDGLLDLVRPSMPTDEPWVLIGESFSGPLSIKLAAEEPAGLQALILCATFARGPLPIPPWLVTSAVFWVPAPTVLMRTLMFEPGAPAPPVAQFMAAVNAVAAPVMATRARAALGADVRQELQSIELPVMYLRAERDRLFGPHVHELVAAHRPGLSTSVIADSPHLVLQRKATEAADAMVSWLDQVLAS